MSETIEILLKNKIELFEKELSSCNSKIEIANRFTNLFKKNNWRYMIEGEVNLGGCDYWKITIGYRKEPQRIYIIKIYFYFNDEREKWIGIPEIIDGIFGDYEQIKTYSMEEFLAYFKNWARRFE